ncbi:MAG TPA: hypothetical protein VGI19_17515 [Candidatus Cybelea sp.]
MTQLIFQANPLIFALFVLVVLGLSIEIPYAVLKRAELDKGRLDAYNVVQMGLLTLTSFVVGLSFAQSSERFTARRALVVKEANAIGTTWLRADQLPAAQSLEFRRILTNYASTILVEYQSPNDPDLDEQTRKRSNAYQEELWTIASGAVRQTPTHQGYSLLMQSLNETIDVSGEQLYALTNHVPTAILVLTLLLVVLSSFSLGLRFALHKSRPPGLTAVFVIAYVLVINMMIDYDRPQAGFVKLNLDPLRLQVAAMQRQER